jgi:mRNA-degrading endonuclease RelE of RelBE toxin-antitoxin system
VSYEVCLSNRAAKDLDRLNRETQQRMVRRLEQIGEAP